MKMENGTQQCMRIDVAHTPEQWSKLIWESSATEDLHLFLSYESNLPPGVRAYTTKSQLHLSSSTAADNLAMAGSPFIKAEPNEYHPDMSQFMQYSQQNQYHAGQGMNVNPMNLSSNGMQQTFGQGSMASSFGGGNAGIADDELLDLDFQQQNQQEQQFSMNQGMQTWGNLQAQQQGAVQQNAAMFSHTPDGAQMQQAFANSNFGYPQFRTASGEQQFTGGHSMPNQFRPHMQRTDRQVSDSRSSATPHTPGINQIMIPNDFENHPGMQQIHHQRQQSSIGNGWDSTPDAQSWNDNSPLASPNGHPMHAQISEVLKNNTHHHHKVASSLPTKMEGGHPQVNQQEIKRRRRRESHNLVERRRRDNINERIQDLGALVPQHRLEDEKVRKHLQTNAPLSPSIANASATGMSPPSNTLQVGSAGRRSVSGGITQGLPLDDKEKGPNKGDILNGSVAWARDLMWYLQRKIEQEQNLKQMLESMGQAWPYPPTEDEKRMLHEINMVIEKQNSLNNLKDGYSRGPGSGLRVPQFTNIAGDASNGDDSADAQHGGNSHQQMSPGFQSGGSGMSSGQMSHGGRDQFWSQEFKEEDEYDLDMQ